MNSFEKKEGVMQSQAFLWRKNRMPWKVWHEFILHLNRKRDRESEKESDCSEWNELYEWSVHTKHWMNEETQIEMHTMFKRNLIQQNQDWTCDCVFHSINMNPKKGEEEGIHRIESSGCVIDEIQKKVSVITWMQHWKYCAVQHKITWRP